MIDYKKLGRIGLDSGEQQKVDTIINVSHQPLVSQYDKHFIKYGYIEVKENKYHIKMSKRERDMFQIPKSIADTELAFAYRVVGALLSDNGEEQLKKEIDTLRDRLQIEHLENDKINKSHQKINGELREEIHDEKHRRQFAEAELKEVKADNKKLAEQNDLLIHTPNGLRKKGLL